MLIYKKISVNILLITILFMLGGWTPALAEGPSHQPFNYPYLQLPDSAFIESLGKDGVKGATGHIMMVGGIYDNTFQEMRQSLLYFKNRGIKNITITLHSQGGSPFSAFSMVQLLKMYQRIHGFNVTIIGFGQVASAACIVMQGASTGQRILMEGGIFMMHDLQIVKFSFGLTFQSVTDQAQEADRDKFIQHKYWKFFSDIMGKTVKETAQLFQNELWMVPKRAVELGLADKVIPTPLVQLPTKEYPDTE